MTYTKESLPLFGASSLITDVPHIAVGEEDVWITTDHGMLQYNKRSDTWKHLVLGRRAGHVAIGEPHGIWVSLNGGGGHTTIGRLDNGRHSMWSNQATEDGLSRLRVRKIMFGSEQANTVSEDIIGGQKRGRCTQKPKDWLPGLDTG